MGTEGPPPSSAPVCIPREARLHAMGVNPCFLSSAAAPDLTNSSPLPSRGHGGDGRQLLSRRFLPVSARLQRTQRFQMAERLTCTRALHTTPPVGARLPSPASLPPTETLKPAILKGIPFNSTLPEVQSAGSVAPIRSRAARRSPQSRGYLHRDERRLGRRGLLAAGAFFWTRVSP